MKLLLPLLFAATTYGQITIPIQEFNESLNNEFFSGNAIAICEEGTTLPLTFHIDGDYLSLDATSSTPLYITKTCYMKFEGPNTFLFSTDLIEWKSFFDFFNGDIRVSIENQNIAIGLKLNQKE